jgi:hypothetical protein
LGRRGRPGPQLSAQSLVGPFYLHALDMAFEQTGLFAVRHMDDVLVLTPTHRTLRQAVGVLNGVLGSLGLEKYPDKTFIGKLCEQEHGAEGPALGSYVRRWTALATGELAECPLVMSAAPAPASKPQPCAA